MKDPIKMLTRREWMLWIASLAAVSVSGLMAPGHDWLMIAAAVVGVTALVFAAKGNVWAQILMVVFSVLYGIISWRFHYWGEMITYLGMTLPMSIWSIVTWLRNTSPDGEGEVATRRLERRCIAGSIISGVGVTAVFYVILAALDTPNLVFSTISVLTSFLAACFTILRSSYYAVGYAANDLVLIMLWSLAAWKDPAYLPVVVNFAVFFLNDLYGFMSWKQRELRQA